MHQYSIHPISALPQKHQQPPPWRPLTSWNGTRQSNCMPQLANKCRGSRQSLMCQHTNCNIIEMVRYLPQSICSYWFVHQEGQGMQYWSNYTVYAPLGKHIGEYLVCHLTSFSLECYLILLTPSLLFQQGHYVRGSQRWGRMGHHHQAYDKGCSGAGTKIWNPFPTVWYSVPHQCKLSQYSFWILYLSRA